VTAIGFSIAFGAGLLSVILFLQDVWHYGPVRTGLAVAPGPLMVPLFAALGGALPVPAQGQGTMNNLTFGNEHFTYYETIGGGQGACADADGPSAVHVTMSNTLTTPAEALELAYPLRVERHALRLGSRGDGLHRGGNGVVRELRVLEPCRISIISERRRHAPQGVQGGEPGQRGRNYVNEEELPSKVTRDLEAGDVVRIETPGRRLQLAQPDRHSQSG
jgi:N-methylhydantoinase B